MKAEYHAISPLIEPWLTCVALLLYAAYVAVKPKRR